MTRTEISCQAATWSLNTTLFILAEGHTDFSTVSKSMSSKSVLPSPPHLCRFANLHSCDLRRRVCLAVSCLCPCGPTSAKKEISRFTLKRLVSLGFLAAFEKDRMSPLQWFLLGACFQICPCSVSTNTEFCFIQLCSHQFQDLDHHHQSYVVSEPQTQHRCPWPWSLLRCLRSQDLLYKLRNFGWSVSRPATLACVSFQYIFPLFFCVTFHLFFCFFIKKKKKAQTKIKKNKKKTPEGRSATFRV